MRDGGEPPIRRVLKPDHCEGNRSTFNLAKQRKGKKCGRSRGDVRERRELWKNTEWVIAEKKESNLCSWSLENKDSVSQHRGLSSGVASGKSIWIRWAYGWVEMSTPLSSCITSGVFLISVLPLTSWNIYILTFMLISCEIVNDFSARMSIWCLISTGSCMFIMERQRMDYVFINHYLYAY